MNLPYHEIRKGPAATLDQRSKTGRGKSHLPKVSTMRCVVKSTRNGELRVEVKRDER